MISYHFHVDIGCHINLTGPTIPFSNYNGSHHFKWRDSSMNRATYFEVTNFGSKSALYYLLFLYN
jgi:hypothetical protein